MPLEATFPNAETSGISDPVLSEPSGVTAYRFSEPGKAIFPVKMFRDARRGMAMSRLEDLRRQRR
jgi:hypothetical protein